MLLPAILHWRSQSFFSHGRAYLVGLDGYSNSATIVYSTDGATSNQINSTYTF